jgi:opacity protein-like surface antigen
MRTMMRMMTVAFALLLLLGAASAQIPTAGNIFFGYSYYNTNLSSINRANTNGWDGSLEGKMLPWVGVVADISGHYGSQNFPTSCVPGSVGGCAVNTNVSEHNVLFGPRVSVSVGKFRPFAEAMVGVGHVTTNNAGSDTSFASAIGGGIDYRIIRPIAWRFEGDYVHTHLFGGAQNNVQISTGIVFRF